MLRHAGILTADASDRSVLGEGSAAVSAATSSLYVYTNAKLQIIPYGSFGRCACPVTYEILQAHELKKIMSLVMLHNTRLALLNYTTMTITRKAERL